LCGKPAPLKGPAHSDNFQDELVDQADPQFGMLDADGDGCVTQAEQMKTMNQQFQWGAPDIATMTAKKKKLLQDTIDMVKGKAKQMFEFVDKNKDACIDKAEFKAAQEMEGPPPGYQESMADKMGKEKFEAQVNEEKKAEFGFMDRSGDNQISRTEAYEYADKDMPHADISKEKMDAMFASIDRNQDGFVSFDEFTQAGKNYEGDGNEMEKAEPMVQEDLMARLDQATQAGYSDLMGGEDEHAERADGEDDDAELREERGGRREERKESDDRYEREDWDERDEREEADGEEHEEDDDAEPADEEAEEDKPSTLFDTALR